MITFTTEQVSYTLKDKRILRSWLMAVIKDKGFFRADVCFIFCSAAYLLQMNKQFLGHSYYTDVITFPYQAPPKTLAGDIFIDVQTVKDNAQEYHTSYEDEVHRVMVHGVLHLLGQDDLTPSDSVQMRAMENEALSLLQTLYTTKP